MTIEPSLMPILLAVAVGLSIMTILALLWLSRENAKLRSDFEDLSEFVHTLNNDFRELHQTTLAIKERNIASELRINAYDDQMRRLAEKISAFQQSETSNQHPYGVAIQKVRSGASVAELMQTAGITQDEATLLIRLHGSKTP